MTNLAIIGIGAVTPVGLSAPAAAAALRAGVARIGTLLGNEVHGPEGSIPLPVGGRVPLEWFDGGPRIQDWPGHERFEMPPPPPDHLLIEDGVERLLRLALPAVAESCQSALGTASLPSDWGLFLGISQDEGSGAGTRLVEAICAKLSPFRPAMIEVIAEGRAAGLAALHRAATALAENRIAGAIVGGVDSLIRQPVYQRLTESGTVKGAANPRGIIPGEAAAFCVLRARSAPENALAVLRSIAIAEEPTAETDKPNQGQGLTQAIRQARSATTISDMPLFLCDLNGDRYRALEWGLVYGRALGDLRWRYDVATCGQLWHPADCVGDTGAASGILNCIWGVEALRKGYALVDNILVWGASEGRLRAAAILTKAS